MFAFTEEERAHLSVFRAIATDEQGREVLIGLTLEETAFYMAHVKQRRTIPDREGRKRYLELDKKHELARLAVVLGGENQLRNENPSRD